MPREELDFPEQSACAGLAVLIASKGRADELGHTLKSVRGQSLQPALIVLSVTSETDLPEGVKESPDVVVFIGKEGRTGQLNRALNGLQPGIELVAFLDDDVELSWDYLKTVVAAFATDAELVGLSGRMLANGGIDRAKSKELITRFDEQTNVGQSSTLTIHYLNPNQGLYGCCMSMRRRVFSHVQFDERLPLYSWLEDADIGIRAQRHGRCGYCPDACLAHLGIKAGRVSGTRFGFAQIMNPVYFGSTGVFRWSEVFRVHLCKVLLANLAGWIRGDKEVDRFGRLRGNFIALFYWVRGRIEPELMSSIEK